MGICCACLKMDNTVNHSPTISKSQKLQLAKASVAISNSSIPINHPANPALISSQRSARRIEIVSSNRSNQSKKSNHAMLRDVMYPDVNWTKSIRALPKKSSVLQGLGGQEQQTPAKQVPGSVLENHSVCRITSKAESELFNPSQPKMATDPFTTRSGRIASARSLRLPRIELLECSYSKPMVNKPSLFSPSRQQSQNISRPQKREHRLSISPERFSKPPQQMNSVSPKSSRWVQLKSQQLRHGEPCDPQVNGSPRNRKQQNPEDLRLPEVGKFFLGQAFPEPCHPSHSTLPPQSPRHDSKQVSSNCANVGSRKVGSQRSVSEKKDSSKHQFDTKLNLPSISVVRPVEYGEYTQGHLEQDVSPLWRIPCKNNWLISKTKSTRSASKKDVKLTSHQTPSSLSVKRIITRDDLRNNRLGLGLSIERSTTLKPYKKSPSHLPEQQPLSPATTNSKELRKTKTCVPNQTEEKSFCRISEESSERNEGLLLNMQTALDEDLAS